MPLRWTCVRLRDLTSVTCYTRLKRELTRSGYALYTQVCTCDNTTRHRQSKAKVERHLQSSGQSLLRKPNANSIHLYFEPLLCTSLEPLLLRQKVAAFTRQCPKAETDSADMTASSQRVSSLQRQLTNELLCKQNVQKHPSCTVHSKMRAQHGSAVCVQIMYDMHGVQNCIPWHDHAMCKEISQKLHSYHLM